MHQFCLGVLVMGATVAGLIFLRFWRKTRDRFFIIFAVSFWLMGLNWFLLAALYLVEEKSSLYVVRLFAFLLILAGIIDKNRPRRARPADREDAGPRVDCPPAAPGARRSTPAGIQRSPELK